MYRKNTSSQHLTFALVNASTGAALTGASVTGRRSIDGGSQVTVTGTISELGNGQYNLALSQADTNGNAIGFLFTATNAIPVNIQITTTVADLTDSVRLGLTGLANAAPGSAGGLLIAGTNTGTTSFTGGVTISSNTDYGLQLISTANNKSALRIHGNAASTHGIIIDAAGTSNSRGVVIQSSSGESVNIIGSQNYPALRIDAGSDSNAIQLNGGDNISDIPVVLIDNPVVSGTGIKISGTGGPSAGIVIDAGGTAISLTSTNDSDTVKIIGIGTDCSPISILSSTNFPALNISANGGPGVQVLSAGGDAVTFQSSSGGHGLNLTRSNSSYNDLNLTNNDSGTWPTVQGYATGQAPLQPTVAGRTLNVSATGLADADMKAINANTTAATNQANAAIAVYSGTVTSSPTTTTLRDTGLTQSDSNFWNGRVIIFTSGGLKYQGAKITAFDPTTDQLTFDAMTSAPSVSNTYIIV